MQVLAHLVQKVGGRLPNRLRRQCIRLLSKVVPETDTDLSDEVIEVRLRRLDMKLAASLHSEVAELAVCM